MSPSTGGGKYTYQQQQRMFCNRLQRNASSRQNLEISKQNNVPKPFSYRYPWISNRSMYFWIFYPLSRPSQLPGPSSISFFVSEIPLVGLAGHTPIFADAHQPASTNISHICGFQRNSCKNHFWCRGASLRPPILSRAISRWRPISFGRHWIRFDRRRLRSSVHRTTFVISRFPSLSCGLNAYCRFHR